MTDLKNLLLFNGKITTLNPKQPEVTAIFISDGVVEAIGNDKEIQALSDKNTTQINLGKKRVIPGLNDSHIHLIRGGLNYNMELRWDGVPSLAYAMEMLKDQVKRTPPPQWVRVIGGWSEFQFAEKRMPSLSEINAVAPETPVFILHLYDRALLNAAALRAVGYNKNSPDPIGGRIERDKNGNPTGALIAEPNALILYSTLAKGPKLNPEDQMNSTRHFMRELNRLGLTSCIDAGGGFQNYPEDYQIIEQLNKNDQLTLRIAYNLFTQKPGHELEDFQRWSKMVVPYSGNSMYRNNGAGEMLVFSAADFEDFLYERPDMPAKMEGELKNVIRFLVENRWPFRLHATYDETINHALNVFEEVNREIPFKGLCWFFDHAETITDHNLERIKALNGGVAIQHRMAYQGEYFINRYGNQKAKRSPPIRKMLQLDLPVGAGTDATRVASYNPWVSLYWMVTGKTVGGTELYGPENKLERLEALYLYTVGSAKLSREENFKGSLSKGMYADLAVLSDDYFAVPEESIKDIVSLLTIVGGKVVYGSQDFREYDTQKPLPVSPDWSPVKKYQGYFQHDHHHQCCHHQKASLDVILGTNKHAEAPLNPWSFGCDCFAW
ncbi:amidohydrolase [Candidatus Protochlamydia phocaeensis]|uniref:amidohydrolase n=1 Tax=Candidatus Protochlamydia phocaeensis TaxID=1414722 RepID=UPI0008380421|nr:amidohydrolase [Candidatus Protochlamydia phocaeensis]